LASSTPAHRDGTNLNNASVPGLDFGQLLAGFGLENFVPPQSQAANPSVAAPSLAQLLSLYANQTPNFPSQTLAGQSVIPSPLDQSQSKDTEPQVPSSKRARTRKSSIAQSDTSEIISQLDATPLNATEDKRRRNTAASARFRLKKKEREQALEKKAKEMEVRVTELERECEGLRRENGWLKGLVVGVTGAQQQKEQQHKTVADAAVPVTIGTKRLREDTEVD